jgi:hypothetical protein
LPWPGAFSRRLCAANLHGGVNPPLHRMGGITPAFDAAAGELQRRLYAAITQK